MTGGTTTVGIEVRADGTQEAARDLAVVDASLKKIQADLGGTAQPAGVAAQGLEQLGAAGKSAGAGLGAVGASAKKAAEGLGSVSKFASSAKFDKVVSDLGAMGVKLNTSSLHAQKLAKAMQQVERERAFQQLAADANLSTLQLAKFRAELGDTRGALATLSNGLGLSKAAMLAFAAAVAFGGQACLEAALQADRLSKAYTTITGSSSAAQQQLSYLYDVSNRLGLQFQSTAESAKTFFAAGKGSSLEKDMNGIFEAVASAGAALALSQDDMQGAFLALGQMISKGKVQAEELRGQLGERLPGAFQLAAKAMGMTTAQLDKFMADGKLTAEDLLPKLAKVMQEEFGAAAEAAAYGLQGQMNRLSTEWTRLKATILDSDSVASVFGTLAEGMKSLADNGEIVAAVVGKGLQWAAWSAGVYAFIKSISGLVAVFQTLKTLAGAVSFAGIFKAAGPVAAALGLVAVAIGSVTTEQDSGEDIGRRYASVTSDIAAALKKQAQAANDAKTSTDQLSESQKKLSASQAIEDQARALQEMQSLATGKSWLEMLGLGGESDEAVEKIREKTVELLTAIRTGQGDVSKLALEIDKLGTTSDVSAKLAASILDWLAKAEKAGKVAGGQFVIVADAARQLIAAAEDAKASLSTGWSIDIADAIKSISALEKGIRAFQAERLGMKGSKLSDILSDFSPEAVKRAQDAYSSKGFGMALKALGIEIGSLTVEQEKNLNTAFRLQKQYDAEAKTTEAYRKALAAEKDTRPRITRWRTTASYVGVEQTEAQLSCSAARHGSVMSFSREQAKILADYEDAGKDHRRGRKTANKKGVSTEQANQLKKQKEIEAGLKRDLDLRQAQEKEEKRLAELARDKYEFYKELEELTGEYGLSLQFQSEVLAAQVKELGRLQIPQEYIEQWKGLKALQSSNDWADGAVRGILKFKAEASDTAGQTESAFTSLFSGIQSASLNMWEDFLETGKLSLSSLKSVFKSFIAQLLQIAVMNPIIVRVATSVQGALWGASAESVLSGSTQSGGISGLIGNIPFSSLLPDSFTSGLSGIMGATLPGTVSALTTPGAYTAGEILLMQGGGTTAGTVGGQAALMSGGLSLGSALMYGGLGSLGYS
ncbi:MAG: tape measure protein, partial [Bilophila wadsworthia]